MNSKTIRECIECIVDGYIARQLQKDPIQNKKLENIFRQNLLLTAFVHSTLGDNKKPVRVHVAVSQEFYNQMQNYINKLQLQYKIKISLGQLINTACDYGNKAYNCENYKHYLNTSYANDRGYKRVDITLNPDTYNEIVDYKNKNPSIVNSLNELILMRTHAFICSNWEDEINKLIFLQDNYLDLVELLERVKK